MQPNLSLKSFQVGTVPAITLRNLGAAGVTPSKFCRVCGRKLSSPRSIRMGVGPVCAIRGTATRLSHLQSRLPLNISALEQLAAIGFGAHDVQTADLDGFCRHLSNIGLVFDGLRSRYALPAAGGQVDSFEMALDRLVKIGMAGENDSTRVVARAGVVVGGLRVMSELLGRISLLSDNDIPSGAARSLDVNMRGALLASRLGRLDLLVEQEVPVLTQEIPDLFGPVEIAPTPLRAAIEHAA